MKTENLLNNCREQYFNILKNIEGCEINDNQVKISVSREIGKSNMEH